MTAPIPVAFYAPLKSPNHPDPSGDRTMARLLMGALRAAGFEPHLASEVRTLEKRGIPEEQARLREASEHEARGLVDTYRGLPPDRRPRLWFTYHVYYKAPDWIGPQVADALRIPYAVAEGSRAGKRAAGPWALGHAGAEAALDRADVIFAMTAHDREALDRWRPNRQAIVDLPPFLDRIPGRPAQGRADNGPPRLLAVAMMRSGDKLDSYRLLADALGRVHHQDWSLDIVGDGPARPEVEALFGALASRTRFHGQVEDRARLDAFYESADLLVWPAVNEAYGMVLLEAQASGCPVLAGAFGGVPSVVRHESTGLLTAPGDPAAFADALARLLRDPGLRRSLGAKARDFVARERSLDHAARLLRHALLPLLMGEAA